MELQSLYPDKTILKVFAELFSKSDPFPFTGVLQSAKTENPQGGTACENSS